jgi:parvulin-like peptidyl-prolyl isomerase
MSYGTWGGGRWGFRRAALLLIAAAAWFFASCTPAASPTPTGPTATPAPPTATPQPMAAMVNGEGILLAEWDAQVTQYISDYEALGKTVTEKEAGQAVLDDMIGQVLLAQGARKDGFDLTPEDLAARITSLEQQVGGQDKLAAWKSDHGYTDATFPVALKRAAEAAYMRDKIVTAVSHTADQVHVRQILLYNQDDANAILNQLKDGADFDALAARIDPTTRGELSWFPRGYLLEPKIEEAAFGMQVGQVSDIIQTDAGYDIIKLIEREPEHELSPDAYLTLQEQALKDWITKERESASIVLAP